jgi:exopolyphosphatase/guanosine-5'-triphosphate,3'-diphosphate pyrophosphatase
MGSNSFRLEIGQLIDGRYRRVDYLKETVRLGAGLDGNGLLTDEAAVRGLACLAKFAQRLKGFTGAQVRAVATQTLREARNRDDFLARAQATLGFPIEVISGREEARLIYAGVARLQPSSVPRLVVDIGGRSTELVLGCGTQTLHTASYRVGSVAWSMKYFPKGEFTEQTLYRAEIAAQAVLDEALSSYPRQQWDAAYGASGTVGAVADILTLAGWPEGQISAEGLHWLVKCLLRAGNVYQVQLTGLKEERRAVLGGGVAVLRGLMDLLQIDTLQVAQGALRHGVLLEMIEREAHSTDARDDSVQRLAQKFAVDAAQAARVSAVATRLLGQLVPAHEAGDLQRKLRWAATLHEVGMAISASDYHKHGAYILENADTLGFSLPELQRLGLLVLGHRGKLKKLEAELEEPGFVMLLLTLRLAVILCHARQDPHDQELSLAFSPKRQRFTLSCAEAWTIDYPQSAHLLRQESLAWQKLPWGFELQLQ